MVDFAEHKLTFTQAELQQLGPLSSRLVAAGLISWEQGSRPVVTGEKNVRAALDVLKFNELARGKFAGMYNRYGIALP